MSAGVLTVVSLAKESTWGTAVTPTKSVGVRPSGGFEIKENIQLIQALRGTLAKNYDSIKGKVAYEGQYTFDAFADYLGYFLLSVLGTDTPALHAGETIVYDHVFTETTPKPSLTIEEAIGENCRRYAGSICKGLKVSIKQGEMVEIQADMTAKTQASSTAITPAFSTVPALNFAQAQVKIGGSVISEVETIELEFKNNLEMVYALGQNEPQFNQPKPSEVHGKITCYLDATTIGQLTAYIGKTRQSIELIVTGTAIGSAANYVLDILIPKADLTGADTKITDSHNMLEIEFDGIYDTATSKLIAVTLTNLITAY